jgi:TRAP-type uncharacterized transport system substrate-binding protein
MDKPTARFRPPRKRSVVRWLTTAAFLLVSVALVVFGGSLLARPWGTPTYELNMLTDLDPNRALLAKRIEAEGKRHGLRVQLSKRPYGALESLKLIDEPNPIEVALVPGGVAERDYPNVRQVTTLTAEPLHLLVRGGLADGGLARLKGLRVNLGPANTAEHWLARDVLAFAGLHTPVDGGSGDFVTEALSAQELGSRLARLEGLSGAERQKAVDALPDAVCLLSALPSILAKDLVTVAGYRLVPLPFADAYCLDKISPNKAGGIRLDRAMFSPTVIPAYTYGVDPAVPAAPCRTIATRLLLIAYAPTEPEAVARLLETVFDGPVAGLAEPVPLRGQVPQFPFHDGAERYMHRNEPLLTPEMVGALAKAGGGLGALISGVIAFYGFMRLRQLRRFEAYFQEIRHIEMLARGQETDPHAPADPAPRRAYLEERLMDLKCRALRDFAEGGLKGEGLMAGIISLVNDTRNSLARLTSASPGVKG